MLFVSVCFDDVCVYRLNVLLMCIYVLVVFVGGINVVNGLNLLVFILFVCMQKMVMLLSGGNCVGLIWLCVLIGVMMMCFILKLSMCSVFFIVMCVSVEIMIFIFGVLISLFLLIFQFLCVSSVCCVVISVMSVQVVVFVLKLIVLFLGNLSVLMIQCVVWCLSVVVIGEFVYDDVYWFYVSISCLVVVVVGSVVLIMKLKQFGLFDVIVVGVLCLLSRCSMLLVGWFVLGSGLLNVVRLVSVVELGNVCCLFVVVRYVCVCWLVLVSRESLFMLVVLVRVRVVRDCG